MKIQYKPTWESVSKHPLPDWYDDCKLGVFLHWGLFSVPGWAPQVGDIQELLKTEGPKGMLKNNPYAEWYMNTMQIEGSPTQIHHQKTYGKDFHYDDFVPMFDKGTANADIDKIAELCKDAGAGYVVLTTKHHEGFALWPSAIKHPRKGAYHTKRDIVGDLTKSVRNHGMHMGLYYSGGYDWPYNDALLKEPADVTLAAPVTPEYREFASAQVKELIDKYHPSVLWNDVSWPPGGNLAELFAYYYNNVPDGVINDRWLEPSDKRGLFKEASMKAAGRLLQLMWRHIPASSRTLTFPSAHWFDFSTPEYKVFDTIQKKKWEATRGVGHSFGANRNERPEDIVTSTELVRMLVDVVSKNGNLLIGIGPDENGVIPNEQQRPLIGLGEWMKINGKAIRGSRPWVVAGTTTSENGQVRFVQNSGRVYAFLLDSPGSRSLTIKGLDAKSVKKVSLLGGDAKVTVDSDDGNLAINLPIQVPLESVLTLDLGTSAKFILSKSSK